MASPRIINEPAEFEVNEIFFSTTDSRGLITEGNEVFERVSGYTRTELLGHAHSVVRHPHMPRCAFRLVWRYLKEAKTVAAMVKNCAKDGRYYWVVALITPCEGGFLSIRFKPTGVFLPIVEKIYEATLIAESNSPDAPMDAGESVLLAGLSKNGFASYDEFMLKMLCEELKSRDASLQSKGLSVIKGLSAKVRHSKSKLALAAAYDEGQQAYFQVSKLFTRLEEFVRLQSTLDQKSTFVTSLTSELRIASMNVSLASGRLGSDGLALGVISTYMGSASSGIAGEANQLVSGITDVSAQIQRVIFNLAAARLQLEMDMDYVHQVISREDESAQAEASHNSIAVLHGVFQETLNRAEEAIRALRESTHTLNAFSHGLSKQILGLQMAQLGGRVESSRIAAGDFDAVFSGIGDQVNRTHDELFTLEEALESLERLSNETPLLASLATGSAIRMRDSLFREKAA